MPTKFAHTNIIAKDLKTLSDFYINVFECKIALPESKMSGDWLEKGSGIENASLKGLSLKLPGYEKDGPTLEIFEYEQNQEKPSPPLANREGYGHIAFSVDDVEPILEKLIQAGGSKIGELVRKEFGKGTLTFIYAADPEGNIIEIQNWEPK